MATKKVVDTFANFAALKVQETAANTQTSVKFAFPFSIMDKMALVVSRIEYSFQSWDKFNSSLDYTYIGLSAAAKIVDIGNQADPLIVDSMAYQRADFGAAASGFLYSFPFVKDFSDLPGGGLLVAPSPLYGIIESSGASAACAAWIKVFYTYMELATDEYWQLVESRRIISS